MFAKKEGLTLGKRVLLPALALCGGAAGFCLRKWQWLSAYDRETELFIEGAPATYALLALLAVVAVALLVLGKMLKQEEINLPLAQLTDASISDSCLRPYRIAKEQGCKFYVGSDSHHPKGFVDVCDKFRLAADMLGLTENDQFVLE